MLNYNKLINNLEILKLEKTVTYLPNYLKSIERKDIALTDALYELTEKEIEFRDERAAKLQIKVSAFPFE